MEILFKYISVALLGLMALFAPITPVVLCALCFILVDFVTGVLASRRESHRAGRKWYFESHEAWRTVRKAGFVIVTIAMMWLVECCVLNFMNLHLTRMIAGAICGVEMWSFLENAATLSDARLFEWLRRYVRRRVTKEFGDYDTGESRTEKL